MAGMPGDTPDRQWALRQAAEAQNHIFDRCVLLFASPGYRCFFFIWCKSIYLVLANVTDYASSQERTVS